MKLQLILLLGIVAFATAKPNYTLRQLMHLLQKRDGSSESAKSGSGSGPPESGDGSHSHEHSGDGSGHGSQQKRDDSGESSGSGPPESGDGSHVHAGPPWPENMDITIFTGVCDGLTEEQLDELESVGTCEKPEKKDDDDKRRKRSLLKRHGGDGQDPRPVEVRIACACLEYRRPEEDEETTTRLLRRLLKLFSKH